MFKLILLAAAFGMASFVLTQVVWPALTGRTMFPIFRAERWRSQRKLAEMNSQKVESGATVAAANVQARVLREESQAGEIVHETLDRIIDQQEKKEA